MRKSNLKQYGKIYKGIKEKKRARWLTWLRKQWMITMIRLSLKQARGAHMGKVSLGDRLCSKIVVDQQINVINN